MAARRRKSRTPSGPRKRDYAAEYRRRVAGTKPNTPERQRKRGKAPKETARVRDRFEERHGMSREEFIELWGGTPGELRDLRKRAYAHVLAITHRVNESGDWRVPTHPQKYVDRPNRDAIRANMNKLTKELLEMTLAEDFNTNAWDYEDPEGELHPGFNPWWYH